MVKQPTFPCIILGKKIGTMTAWDQLDTVDVIFYEVTRNDLGKQFMPDFVDGSDLDVHFAEGTVTQYDSSSSPDPVPYDLLGEAKEDNGNPVVQKVDWGVFNA